jgi:hypothetical protein
MSGTFCGGRPTRPALSAGFSRTRYATPTRLNGSRRPDMNVLRDPLGQASLATMGRYLRDVAPVHVIETMKRREWSLG